MSWIRRRPLTALAALALALRLASAVATEFDPIFPAYYYTDATRIHAYALGALEEVRAGRPPTIDGTLAERIQTAISLGIYRALGPSPFAVKVFNAAVGALAVAAFAWGLSAAFSPRAAMLAGLTMAVWPSHVFYTSQNLKEAPVGLLAYATLGSALLAGLTGETSSRRSAALAASAAACLIGVGFYRSYVLVCLSAALLAALVLSAARAPKANVIVTAAALLAALALYPSASRVLLASFHARALGPADRGRIEPSLIPVTYDNTDDKTISRPTSPQGITHFRRTRQSADRLWAINTSGREIGTQIYPDAEFRTWLDVALYLPKGAFAVLFAPLPGVHAMEGKIGRWAASGENVLLLVLGLLGAAGFVRGRKTPGRLCLLVFFATMTAGASLLEFDLGSAGRHKLLYLPMLFPFAAEEALRLLRAKEPA